MNSRKITIVDSKLQKRSTIMSEAETLGELKRDLTANGINYSGKTFMEGLSRSELKEDASILPHDIQRPDGSVTNELVFMLTEPEKKIKSGATLTRQECYAKVKELGLQAAVQSRFGKNFTQCSTDDLNSFLAARAGKASKTAKPAPKAAKAAPAAAPKKEVKASDSEVVKNATAFTNKLLEAGAISPQNGQALKDILAGKAVSEIHSDFTDAEIRAMFAGMVK